MRFAVLTALLVLNLPAHGQTTAAASPFWVEVTQEHKYPGTEWVSSPGMVEQVIAEDDVNYVVTSPNGAQLKLPKAYSKKLTGEEAAIKLFAERKKNYDLYMGQLVREDEIVKQAKEKIVEYDTALKESEAKVAEYEQGFLMLVAALKAQQQNQPGSTAEAQQTLPLMQQLQGMSGKGGGGSISKSDRARMEKDIWAAGLAKLYSARQMSDADLQALWLQARQILETRAAGQNRR